MTPPTLSAPTTLHTAPTILLAAAAAKPDQVRFLTPAPLTLGTLARRVGGFAAYLRDQGVLPGQHVAIFAPNSVDWIVAALGAQLAGAAFVGVHAGSSSEQASYVIEHSQAKLVVACPGELARAGVEPSQLSAPVVCLGSEPFEAACATAPLGEDLSTLDGTACLIYTSGTTGRPKGVVLTHRNLAVNGADWVEVCAPTLPSHEQTREVLWLPFSHVFGWGDACIGTLMGFASRLCSPKDVVAALGEHRPHVLMTVPVLLERLSAGVPDDANLRAVTGGELRLCLAGGAALSPRTKARLHAAGIPVCDGYGLTETSPTLTLVRPDDRDPEHHTVGAPYPSVELKLAPDGEVLARGPSVFGGYYRDAESTSAAFDEDGWFRTGDLGRLTARGNLELIDRKKELLILQNGKNVAPQPIEARAAEEPWIERLVLFGSGHPGVVGLVVVDVDTVSVDVGRPLDQPLDHAEAASDPAVRAGLEARFASLNDRLSSCERVRRFAVLPRPLSVEAGHLTPSFKVRRRQVAADFDHELNDLLAELSSARSRG
jgi:long-chain acyl-CoA synthetase